MWGLSSRFSSQPEDNLTLNLLKFNWFQIYTKLSHFHFLHLFVVVTTTSNKPTGDISGLDVNVICFCILNVACDKPYLKILDRTFNKVIQMGADVLAQ